MEWVLSRQGLPLMRQTNDHSTVVASRTLMHICIPAPACRWRTRPVPLERRTPNSCASALTRKVSGKQNPQTQWAAFVLAITHIIYIARCVSCNSVSDRLSITITAAKASEGRETSEAGFVCATWSNSWDSWFQLVILPSERSAGTWVKSVRS